MCCENATNLSVVDVNEYFLFKQKTADEMRISDWSSDVCSSDLLVGDFLGHVGFVVLGQHLLGDEGVAAHVAGGDHRLVLAEQVRQDPGVDHRHLRVAVGDGELHLQDRKSTRLNSSH